MRRIGNEQRTDYSKSYEAQGQHVVIDGVTYFNQISHDMESCDKNYHLMVNLLAKLFNNRNFLRFEAPKWYSNVEKMSERIVEIENMNLEEDEETDVDDMKRNVDNDIKWIKPKKVGRPMQNRNVRKDESSENVHEVLSENEDSDEEEAEHGENTIVVVVMCHQNVTKRMTEQQENSYVRKYPD